MRKTIVEWVSRILWLMGVLFALIACVCLIIAFSKTETATGQLVRTYAENSSKVSLEEGCIFLSFPEKLYKAVGYDAVCAFFCFVSARALHWFSTEGE